MMSGGSPGSCQVTIAMATSPSARVDAQVEERRGAAVRFPDCRTKSRIWTRWPASGRFLLRCANGCIGFASD